MAELVLTQLNTLPECNLKNLKHPTAVLNIKLLLNNVFVNLVKHTTLLKIALFLMGLLAGSSCFATTRIAFLELYNSKGELIQYEPNGRFGHTAIQFDEIGDHWLNAYPSEGVAIISLQHLQNHGKIADIIEIPDQVHLQWVQPHLGKPFDFQYSWNDEAFYCTELIGKLLGVPTHPMHFNHKVWPKNYWQLEGTAGLSPDQLWIWARQRKK